MPEEGDIQTYEMLMEATVRKQVHIEGRSPEHCAQIALEMCAQPQEMEVQLTPTWMETVEQCAATGELSLEILGPCSKCGKAVVNRDLPGKRWTWTTCETSGGLLCYDCGKAQDG